MASPFIAEITLFAGTFAPRGWAFCNGQQIALSQNTALFSVLGTTYGGNGTTNFFLPDLQGRVPVHPGQGPGLSSCELGMAAGAETVTLLTTTMPAHSHAASVGAGGAATSPSPSGRYPATPAGATPYADTGDAAMHAKVASAPGGVAGGGLPHNNLMPSLAVSFIIALQGVFPTRN